MATATLKRVAKSKPEKSMRMSRGSGAAREDGLKPNNVSSATVADRTGKSWEQWLKVLDAAGAKQLDHKGIVEIVADRFSVAMERTRAFWKDKLDAMTKVVDAANH